MESKESIVIMGSSRAAHHYDSQVFSDGLSMSCINMGEDGNGIVLQYGRWKMISKRYTPKIIIYDISSHYDIENNDNLAYINRLRTYNTYSQEVKRYVSYLFPMEKIKLLSQLYCFNYNFFEVLYDCSKKREKGNGFTPLKGNILQAVACRQINKKSIIDVDSLKLSLLESLINESANKGTKMVFVVSPLWHGGNYDLSAFSSIIELTQKYNVPFYYYFDSPICDVQVYFKDSGHLNAEGALVFTKDLVNRLKENGELF